MPAPIIPAPRTATFCALYCGYPAGRDPPLVMCCRSKKNAFVMFLLTWPAARFTKYSASMVSALTKSTCEPSTAADMMWCGAGIGAPLICLRRLAGNAGSTAANFGLLGVPPGIL